MTSNTTTHAAQDAARLRSALRYTAAGDVVRMVCTPRERDAIWAELTPAEKRRVQLLTAWPWDTPALISEALAAAA